MIRIIVKLCPILNGLIKFAVLDSENVHLLVRVMTCAELCDHLHIKIFVIPKSTCTIVNYCYLGERFSKMRYSLGMRKF